MFYYYPVYIPLYFQPYLAYRQYPPVDPELFHQSANEMRKLLSDASAVLGRLADSKEFSQQVMSAAQESNNKEVERLIKSTGISSDVDIFFNPDNLRLEFKAQVEEVDCCHLTVAVKWR